MRILKSLLRVSALTFVMTACFAYIQAQQVKEPKVLKLEPKLVDSFGRSNGEDRSARFDHFVLEIANEPNSVGYVLIYCGKSCHYGEVEAHLRGIELKITNRFDRSRIVVLSAGFRDEIRVELWLVAVGACPPTPTPTVNIKQVKFYAKYKTTIEPYDCCDDLEDQWKRLRP